MDTSKPTHCHGPSGRMELMDLYIYSVIILLVPQCTFGIVIKSVILITHFDSLTCGVRTVMIGKQVEAAKLYPLPLPN